MRIKTEGRFGSFKNINVERPWGYFGLYSDNEKCTSKVLYVKPKHSLSLQLHQKRSQFYLLFDDLFMVEMSDQPVPEGITEKADILKWFEGHRKLFEGKEGYMFGFEKRVIHRLLYIGNRRYGRCLDLAFGDNDELDIIRLDDEYGR